MHRESSEQLGMPADLYGRAHCAKKHDWASYVWLAYSVFFFVDPILRNNRAYWIQQLAVYLLFLALYVTYVQFPDRRVRLPVMAAFFVMGAATMPFNAGGTCFFIYVAAMLPFCVEAAWVLWTAIALEMVVLAIEFNAFPANKYNYLICGFFAVVVGMSNAFIAQNKRADLKLQRAQAENVELAAVAERERIARDLHDVLGHTLSVIVLKAELAGRLMGRDAAEDRARAAAEIADVERTARTALAEVREAIGGYRAKGLQAELDAARMTLDAAGVVMDCPSRPPLLKAREETVLSLVVREAVTNIVRHAQATTCTMSFRTTPDGFCSLEVADNGATKIEREGNGLRGMRERVQELGGRFRIEAERGTTLVIELPRTALSEG
jgi:two-component system sensor histidine kinase DesK